MVNLLVYLFHCILYFTEDRNTTIETLEERVKYFLLFLLLTLNIFYTFFSVFFADLEQVNVYRGQHNNRNI